MNQHMAKNPVTTHHRAHIDSSYKALSFSILAGLARFGINIVNTPNMIPLFSSNHNLLSVDIHFIIPIQVAIPIGISIHPAILSILMYVNANPRPFFGIQCFSISKSIKGIRTSRVYKKDE